MEIWTEKCLICGNEFVNNSGCTMAMCGDCLTVNTCVWCGGDIDPEDPSTYFCAYNYRTEQPKDYTCCERCDLRHGAYVQKCECGWHHSDRNCPVCGKLAPGEETWVKPTPLEPGEEL